MELGGYNIGKTLKSLVDKHKFTPSENICTLKLLMYIDKSKEFKSPKKNENLFTEILKMYLLELCFRKKFFGILRYQKSIFIEREIYNLPEDITTEEELIELFISLEDKTNPIRRKIKYSKIYLPHDVLKLLSE
jgi:hypothetical protein